VRFGIHFIPTVGPEEKSAAAYYDECLDLAERADALGYGSIKIGEHYLFDYGGYSPDPIAFLSAAAQRTQRIRLATGGVFPAFTHPVKLASQLAMLDHLSHGRLDVGFARAFLPEEFDAFQVPLDESGSRFEEGIEAIRWLWTHDEASWSGQRYQFGPVRILPRPCQQPTRRCGSRRPTRPSCSSGQAGRAIT
jgi:alkanesulfonate monooxygenase SsuD/methylene tetrahydromethanopterin reductase-like flavin-dependent oxidoreductase (luciferase family)